MQVRLQVPSPEQPGSKLDQGARSHTGVLIALVAMAYMASYRLGGDETILTTYQTTVLTHGAFAALAAAGAPGAGDSRWDGEEGGVDTIIVIPDEEDDTREGIMCRFSAKSRLRAVSTCTWTGTAGSAASGGRSPCGKPRHPGRPRLQLMAETVGPSALPPAPSIVALPLRLRPRGRCCLIPMLLQLRLLRQCLHVLRGSGARAL